MSKAVCPSRLTRKKTVRIVSTAFTGLATGAAIAVPAAPAQATAAYEALIWAKTNIPISKGVQVCGHNQNNVGVCRYATYLGNSLGVEFWSTPNWWWKSNVTLWWNSHHSRSNCGANVQNAHHSDYHAWLYVSYGQHNCLD